MYTTYPDYLAHHGVLGMKWGVRKQRASSGGSVGRAGGKSSSQGSGRGLRGRWKSLNPKTRTRIKVGAGIAAAALAAYGAYRFANMPRPKGLLNPGKFKTTYLNAAPTPMQQRAAGLNATRALPQAGGLSSRLR